MNKEKLQEALQSNSYWDLRNELIKYNSVDIADFLEELDLNKLILVYRILPKDICAEIFSYMTSDQQRQIIERISDWEVRQIIDDLYLDDTVDFLEEVPAGVVKKVLKNVDESTRMQINTFLQYKEDSSGSIMTVEFVDLHHDLTVKEAIDRIRKTGTDKETIYTCYVINKERKLLGTIALRKLLIADEDTKINELMNENVITVYTHDDQEYVADMVRKYDLLSIPVVDNERRLVGIITVDDIMDVIEEENTEDFEIMAAMSPSEAPYLKSSVWTLAKNRIIWLLVLMVSSSFAQLIINRYEDVLATMMTLTAFIPMLTDTGGNAGSQSSTMVIRGLALGEVTTKDSIKVVWKELRVSIICGGILAVVNFFKVIYLNRVGVIVSLIVSISIFITVVIAKVIGGALPIFAKKLKLDPALMASPVITTVVDSLGLIVYFTIATRLMSFA